MSFHCNLCYCSFLYQSCTILKHSIVCLWCHIFDRKKQIANISQLITTTEQICKTCFWCITCQIMFPIYESPYISWYICVIITTKYNWEMFRTSRLFFLSCSITTFSSKP
jgi:hypothetical protein